MIVKKAFDINFAQGLDTKTDPKRVQMGNFVNLENTVFTKGGLLQKRNGYAQISSLPDTSYSYLTTFNNNLTALGNKISAFNTGNNTWVTKGDLQPLSLSTLPLIRNNFNQSQVDTAISANGLICSVYLENNGTTTVAKYAIADAKTGQNIVAPTPIPVSSGTVTGGLRVFYLGTNFIIVFTNVISATNHLQYVSVNSVNTSQVSANTDIASSYVPSSALSFDGYIANNKLYIAYDTTSGGQSVNLVSLNTSFLFSSTKVYSGYTATHMSVTVDTSNSSAMRVYVSFYNSGSNTGYTLSTDANLNPIMNPVEIISSGTISNITSVAMYGSCYVYYEVSNNYSYDSTIATHYINGIVVTPLGSTFRSVFLSGASSITVNNASGLVNGMYLIDQTTAANITAGTTFTVSGTTLTLSANTAGNSASSPGDTLTSAVVSAASTIVRSVGLASKAFIIDGMIYFLSAYQSSYQSTYFLINAGRSLSSSPVLAAKLAYENGGGYLTQGLPNVAIDATTASIPYLYKDLIQAVNKDTNIPSGTQTAGIYAQLGINLSNFDLTTANMDTSSIGLDLHLAGGFLWMYDGYLPVEHLFFLWPDNVEGATQADPVVTGNTSNTSPIITNVSSTSGIGIGMTISGTGIAANSVVVSFTSNTVTMNKNGASVQTGTTLTFEGAQIAQQYFYQVTYEWCDNQGNLFRSAPSIPISVTTTSGNSSVVLNIPTLRLTMKIASPVKICIYRWSAAQQIYYQITSIFTPLLNDTTIDSVKYVDGNSDASILGNNILYTTGGVVENIAVPATNLMTIFDTRLWLVNAEDPNTVWYSKQVIENTPVETSDVFTIYIPPTTSTQGNTGPITGIAPLDDKIIFFKRNAILYLNGTGPDNTGANNQYSQPIFVTSTVGCTNQNSIVLMPNGLMFQSDKGIWLLDRNLGTTYIGSPVEKFTTDALVNSAVNIEQQNQVRFTLDSGITLMYDYYYSQWGTFTGVPAVSSCIYAGSHTYINEQGNAYEEKSGTYIDGSNPVLIKFQTGPLNFNMLQGYQRAYFFYLLGTYYSPHKLYVSMFYDYEISPSQSVLISPINYSTPFGSGASQSPFGQGNPFGGGSNLESWRVFFERQRCMAVSIGVQEIYDSTLSASPGQGLSLSGINMVLGLKKDFRPQSASQSIG